jgi:hypothetical protein
VEVLARLENFRVPGGRPYLALAEDIDLTISGRRVSLTGPQASPCSRPRSIGTIAFCRLYFGLASWIIRVRSVSAPPAVRRAQPAGQDNARNNTNKRLGVGGRCA